MSWHEQGGDEVKYIKTAAVALGLIYFAVGAVFSLTLGGNDFWSGAAVYIALFLLPLPISIVGVWFPKIAGFALIACAATSVTVSVVTAISTGTTPDLAGLCKFTMFQVPHLAFALVYVKAGPASRNADPGSEETSAGTA